MSANGVIPPPEERQQRRMLRYEVPIDDEPHTLIVHSVTLPEGRWDDGSLEYDLEHPATCKQGEPCYPGVVEYLCDLAYQERDEGLAGSLRYSGTPITEPGTYRIQAWGRKTYHWEYGYEYDSGVGVMEPEGGEAA